MNQNFNQTISSKLQVHIQQPVNEIDFMRQIKISINVIFLMKIGGPSWKDCGPQFAHNLSIGRQNKTKKKKGAIDFSRINESEN